MSFFTAVTTTTPSVCQDLELPVEQAEIVFSDPFTPNEDLDVTSGNTLISGPLPDTVSKTVIELTEVVSSM